MEGIAQRQVDAVRPKILNLLARLLNVPLKNIAYGKKRTNGRSLLEIETSQIIFTIETHAAKNMKTRLLSDSFINSLRKGIREIVNAPSLDISTCLQTNGVDDTETCEGHKMRVQGREKLKPQSVSLAAAGANSNLKNSQANKKKITEVAEVEGVKPNKDSKENKKNSKEVAEVEGVKPNKDAVESMQGASEGGPMVPEGLHLLKKSRLGSGADVPILSHVPSLRECKSQKCDIVCATQSFQRSTNQKYCRCFCCGDGSGLYCWACQSTPPQNEPNSCRVATDVPVP